MSKMMTYQAANRTLTRSPARFFLKCVRVPPANHAFGAFGTTACREKSSLTIIGDENNVDSSWKPTKDADSNIVQNRVPNFNDSRAAYESKGIFELLRASVCFNLCKIPILVNNAESLLRILRKVLGNTVIDGVLKATSYGHFCAGEDEKRIQPVLNRLENAGVGSILDYAAESDGEPSPPSSSWVVDTMGALTPQHHAAPLLQAREYDYESEAQCNRHVETFKTCINNVAKIGGRDGYAAIKVTALGNPKLLAWMSQAIMEAKRLFEKFDENMDGYVSREEFEHAYNVFFNDRDVSLKHIFEQFDPNGTGKVDDISWSMCLAPKDLPSIMKQC